MIIFKPEWIRHAEREKGVKMCIYSIHVHPDGKRLATGGLDAAIRIWNTKPILDEAAENDPQCHKLLCTLTRHNGAVLCVRWSNTEGRYLASSSDNDNVIIIWEMEGDTVGEPLFGSSEVNYEQWRAKKYLRGHDSDVQDLAWSKDNQYLASCSVDGSVIVWNGTTFDQVTRINQQGGFVKGIAWDPVGKYLASQSDNKMLKVWRTSDWSLVQEIKGPFINAPGTTLFRRLSWAPTGTQLATANATNGVHCVAAIISREDWSADVSLVGHRCPIEVACFNPKLFYLSDSTEGIIASDDTTKTENMATVCALGGQDHSLSVWVTKYDRPVCVVSDIFEGNVYDLAWSPDGQSLFACAHDGTVACLRFEEILTRPASDEQVIRQLAAYGYKSENGQLPESAMQLELEEIATLKAKAASSNRIADLMGSSTPSSDNMTLAPVPTDGKSATGSTVASSPPTITKSPQSKIPSASQPSDADFTSSSTRAASDGREQSAEPTQNVPRVEPKRTIGNIVNWADGVTYDFPSAHIPALGIGSVVIGNKRRLAEGSEPAEEDMDVDSKGSARKRPVWIDTAMIPPAAAKSQVRLGVPKVISNFVWTPRDGKKTQVVMECDNHDPMSDNSWACARISVSTHGNRVWQDYLPSPVVLMTGSSSFYAAACEDGTLHVYSKNGIRILPPIVVDSTISLLHSTEPWLLCITTTGLLYTWNVNEETCSLDGVSIAPVLRIAQLPSEEQKEAPTIKDVRIQANGLPLIVTNYQQAFTYHIKMKVWMRISDAWYIVSNFWSSSLGHPHDYPLGWLSAAMSLNGGLDPVGKVMLNFVDGNKEAVGAITLSHIEIQLAVAALLNSPSEYKQWLLIYAKKLSMENSQNKTKELCQWLIGPPLYNNGKAWEEAVLGLLKRDLLKEVLPLLGHNRQMQRLISEYSTFVNSCMT
ncbi:WD40-repeat-containing domain protein [Dichotomocladium elegans]|nr:WD40-repeat-containing domain protein [Dichotomocladium elegans]